MGLFNKFKKATKDIKKTLDESSVMEKAKETTDTLKNKSEKVTSNMARTKAEYLIIEGKKEHWISYLSQELKKHDFKDIRVSMEDYQIEARYFKLAINQGGKGKVRIIFDDEGEVNTKITIEITISSDTASSMQTNYTNIYNAVRESINEDVFLESEEFQGIYEDVKNERNAKIENIMGEGIGGLINSEERKQQREEGEGISQMIFGKKLAEIEMNMEDGKEGFFNRYSKDEMNTFTEEFFEKLCMVSANTNLKFGSYIEDKGLSKAKSLYGKDIGDNEYIFLYYSPRHEENFILTDKCLYISMKEHETGNLYRGKIEKDKIQKLNIIDNGDNAFIRVNDVTLFAMKKSNNLNDYINLKNYINRLESGKLVIKEEEISEVIESSLDKKILKRIKGFLQGDESIIYVAWGLDSLTAKDYVVCTNKQLMIINRGTFGASEHIKQFEYKDIVSISTAKSTNADLITDIFATLFKQSDLEIYVSGTSFRIETLLRIEAERVIKIVNEYKRKGNSYGNTIIHERIIKEEPKEDILEQIQKLATLRDSGILTEEEFQIKKTELLKRL